MPETVKLCGRRGMSWNARATFAEMKALFSVVCMLGEDRAQ